MELFVLFLWLKLGVLIGVLTAVCAALGVSLLLMCFFNAVEYDKVYSNWKKHLAAFVGAVLITGLVPSQKDTAILVGAHYALKVAESPEAGKVVSLLRKKANDMLDSELAGKKETN